MNDLLKLKSVGEGMLFFSDLYAHFGPSSLPECDCCMYKCQYIVEVSDHIAWVYVKY